jgi:hypothetical protein
MGSEIEDSSRCTRRPCARDPVLPQADRPLLSTVSSNDVAVLYDVASNVRLALEREVFADNRVNDTTTSGGPLLGAHREPRSARRPLRRGGGERRRRPSWYLAADDLAAVLGRDLPGAADLPDWAVTELDKYQAGGGTVIRDAQSTGRAGVASEAEIVRAARAASGYRSAA